MGEDDEKKADAEDDDEDEGLRAKREDRRGVEGSETNIVRLRRLTLDEGEGEVMVMTPSQTTLALRDSTLNELFSDGGLRRRDKR